MGSLLSVNQIGGKIEIEEEPTAYGGFANVFKGEHATHGKVALKLVSLATSQEEQQDPDLKEQVLQLILAEAEIWRTLKHPHIVKFLGLYTYNDRLCMVSLWAEGGCLMAYLRRNPSADRTRFIREIADALTYLHGRKIVHGDIKGPNVLLSRETSVLLCDFGMSKLVDDKTKLLLKGGGSYRWMAPELLQEVLDGDGKPKSFETDVFSFGMTIYEVLSGNPPLHDYKYDFAAASAIVKGKRPPKEPGNSPSGRSYEPIWNIADSCWLMEPSARPSMTKVFNDICNLSESFTPPVVVSTSDPPPGVAASNTVHPNLDGDALDYRAQIQQHTPLPEHKTLFTDMYRGVIPTDRVILISTVHPYRSKPAKINEEVEEAIKRHVRAWKDQPSHPAIIQYMGYAVIEGLPCVISEWHENGDVLAYLDTNRRADRNALIKQVAGGLLFLHTQEPAIVHGDVVSRNVAINNLGEAVLRNCALWSLYGDKNLYRRQSITSRFLPKLFHPIRPSQETDVYFFGELSLEMLARGKEDHSSRRHQSTRECVMCICCRGTAPETTEPFVEVLEECCHQDSTKRPPMKTVCASLNRPTGGHNSAKTASVDLGDVPATHVEFDPQQTIATGSHCDVFVGADANKRRVGLKRYRITASRYLNDDVLNIKQDAEVWSSLHHDYILSFLGIGQDSAGRVYSATLWMDKGALPDYLRNNPDTADRPRLMREIAEALVYLKSQGVVHGDIRGANILISPDDHALLCDFIFPTIVRLVEARPLRGVGNIPWQSPELLENGPRSFASDTYAFGMTIYEVLTGSVPFSGREPMAIINAVIIGDERPTKPEAVIGGPSHDYMWDIADRCWNKDPGVRPPIETVLVWTQKKKCDAPGNNSDPISSSGSPRKPVTRVLGPQDVLLESPPVGSSTKVETTRDAARPLPPLKDPRPLQEDSAQSSALVATNQGRTATMSTDVTQEKRSLLQPTTSFFGFSTEKVSHWQESETEAVPHFPLPYPGPPLVGPNIVSEGTSYTLSTTLRGQLLSTLAVSGTVATEVSDLEGIPSLNLLSSVVPYKRGGNSDVYRGELPQGQMIAIKVLRSGEITDSEKPDLLAKRLEREMRLWKSLDHKYINRVLGFAFLETGVCLIGPWRANGNALGYLEMNPSADRRRLLLQATEGLAYLHNHDPTIVHTDIKANNVLVDDDGEAKLCDFGLSRLLQDVLPGLTTSDLRQESLRWMAPEQLLREDIYTTESDVYALGCLIIEIISGKVPFVEYNNITNMMLAKVQGKLMNYTGYPELPEDDPLWPLLHACWATEPQLRPPINEVVNQLSRL